MASTISIHRATIDDLPAMIAVSSLAFSKDPLHSAAKPREMTAEQTAEYTAWRVRMSSANLAKPNVYYYKAIDDAAGTIVGLCAWGGLDVDIGGDEAAAKQGNALPSFLNAEVFGELAEASKKLHDEIVGERKDYWRLQTMAVHPDYQRRGIGRQLIMHGLADVVDKDSSDSFVQASAVGISVYRSCGYEEKMSLSILNGTCEMAGMWRKGRPVGTSGTTS